MPICSRAASSVARHIVYPVKREFVKTRVLGRAKGEKMHAKNVDRFIRLISSELNRAGIYSPKAESRARTIVNLSVKGAKLTPYVVASELHARGNCKGIENDLLRAQVAIEIARIWVYMTSKSANDACLRLHLEANLTKRAAAQWLLKRDLISRLIHDSLIRDHYHGGVDSQGIVIDDQTGVQIDFGKTIRKDPRRGLVLALRKLEIRRRLLSDS